MNDSAIWYKIIKRYFIGFYEPKFSDLIGTKENKKAIFE